MEQNIPDWLNKEFLTNCLRNKEPNIVVTDYTVSSAVPPGNNISSVVLRVKLEYKKEREVGEESQSLSLIVKTEAKDGLVKELLGNLTALEKIFYEKFLMRARNLTQTSFAPRAFYNSEDSTLVLEDLKEEEFVMADRTKQLDFDHCQLYVKAAALFHAVSFAVHKETPELVESLGAEKMFGELKHNQSYIERTRLSFIWIAEFIETSKQFSKYSKLIRDCSQYVWYMVTEAHKPSKVLNTLNQGDPWTTNMMFKYDKDGVVSDIRLLDFQLVRYGSPINDLVYFIWTSATHDVRKYRVEDLYKIYLNAFNKHLEEFNCDERLTWQHLNETLKILSPAAILYCFIQFPLYVNPTPRDTESFLQTTRNTQDEHPSKKYYNAQFYNVHLLNLLEQLESAGVFDYLENYCK